MRPRSWQVYIGVGVLAMVPELITADIEIQTATYVLVMVGGLVALVVGLRRHRPAQPAPWRWLIVGVTCMIAGDLTITVAHLIGVTLPELSPADGCYTMTYLAVIRALVLIVRHRRAGNDRASVIDAAILTTSVAMVGWVFALEPMIRHHRTGLTPTLTVALVYALADLAIAAMLVRIVISGGLRTASLALLAVGTAMLLVADTAKAVLVVNDLPTDPSGPRVVPYMLLYLCWGAAALHTTMPEVAAPVRQVVDVRWSRRRVLLTTASLLAPGILLAQALQQTYTSVPVVALTCIVLFLLVVVRMSDLVAQVQCQARQLTELAHTDGLTGLPNRRAWDDALADAVARARTARVCPPLHVALLDLDHFKRYNDTEGHQAGDELLRAAAAAWRTELRGEDLLARYGGEEFAMLIPGGTQADAAAAADRLRSATPLGQTFSAGVATWLPGGTPASLMECADVALYSAKAAGRNRVHRGVPAAADRPVDDRTAAQTLSRTA